MTTNTPAMADFADPPEAARATPSSHNPLEASPRYKSMAKLHALLTKPSLNALAHGALTPPSPRTRLRLHVAAAQARLAQVIAQEKAAKMELTPTQRKTAFPFLALPAELRVLVYEELLVTDDRLVVTWRGPKKARAQQKGMWTGVLRCCRLASGEGRGVLYGRNVFDFEEIMLKFSTGASFLSAIGRPNAAHIRHLVASISATRELRPAPLPVSTNPKHVETLRQTHATAASPKLLDQKEDYHINRAYLTSFLASFGIDFRHLRMLAVHLKHTGKDWYDSDWMEPVRRMRPAPSAEQEERIQRGQAARRADEVERAAEVVLEREGGWLSLLGEEEARDMVGWVGGEVGRGGGVWFVYRGMPWEGEGVVKCGEKEEVGEAREENRDKGKGKGKAVDEGGDAANHEEFHPGEPDRESSGSITQGAVGEVAKGEGASSVFG